MNESILKLSIASVIPAAVSALLYLAEKKWKDSIHKNSRSEVLWQILAGILFGGIAVLGNEWGIPMNGATVNCRDGAVLTAGFLFGGPAGIIAGVIGGAERWFAVAWGAGSFTRIACSISTLLAGIYAALLRRFLFDGKRPGWFMSFVCGIVMEVVHLTMVFLTNLADVEKASAVVRSCTVPMILANGLGVLLATLTVTLLSGSRDVLRRKTRRISDTIQRWLLVVVVFIFLLTTTLSYLLQTSLAVADAQDLLYLEVSDIAADIKDASDANLLAIAENIRGYIGKVDLDKIAEQFGVAEINIINRKGIIRQSTNPDFKGYDMAAGAQSAEFLCLLQGEVSYVQDYGPISMDSRISRKYAGIICGSGFLQVGYDAEEFQAELASQIQLRALNRRVGKNGLVFIVDAAGSTVSATESPDAGGDTGEQTSYSSLIECGLSCEPYSMAGINTEAETWYCMTAETEGYTILAFYPLSEAMNNRNTSVYINSFMQVMIFAVLFAMVFFLIKNVVVNQIDRINSSLSEITGGNLGVVVDVRSNEEFASLSDDINHTVDTMKKLIDEAAARIDRELEFARSIQSSALPNVFPAFPHRPEFDIYASMFTAKEVGGDFYDFYMSDDGCLNFLVADVSGKGIPAALFMMRSKVQLKSLTENGMPVEQVFTIGNAHLCEGNDADMFVTAWQGKLDPRTGRILFANAGHNPPLVKHGNGSFEYFRSKVSMVLAGIDITRYPRQELQLQPGDILYLYTDGVTEATNAREELYGEERLKNLLSSCGTSDVKEICRLVKEDLDSFVGTAPQFDDITMVAIRYDGPEGREEVR